MTTPRVTDLKQIAGLHGYQVTQIRDLTNPEWFFVLDGQAAPTATPEFLMRGPLAQRTLNEWENEVRRRAKGQVERICLGCAKQQGLREERVGKLLPLVFIAGRRVRQRTYASGKCGCSYCGRRVDLAFDFADG